MSFDPETESKKFPVSYTGSLIAFPFDAFGEYVQDGRITILSKDQLLFQDNKITEGGLRSAYYIVDADHVAIKLAW